MDQDLNYNDERNKKDYPDVLKKSDAALTPNDIQGIHLYITYENNSINIVSATSLNIFTMDKTLDKYWDSAISKYLDKFCETEINY